MSTGMHTGEPRRLWDWLAALATVVTLIALMAMLVPTSVVAKPPPSNVYVETFDGFLYGLDAQNGMNVRSYSTGTNLTSTPAVANGTVYFGSDDGYLHALDATTLKEKWNLSTNFAGVKGWIVTVGTFVYFADMSGALYKLTTDAAGNNMTRVWTLQVSAKQGIPCCAKPAIVNGMVYVGSSDFSVYAIADGDLNGAAVKWSFQTGGQVTSSPAVVDNTIYVGSLDGFLYALDAVTGQLRWRQQTGAGIISSPTVAHGIVYVGSGDGNVYAFAASDGTLIWRFQTGGPVISSPAVVKGVVYVGSWDHNIYALGPIVHSGQVLLLWKHLTGGPVTSSPAVANGVVYVGSGDAVLYALGAR
ncbi:MAG TPA: PQQ-binding-like beta-propeller repeat protein, partial [Ktedonobacterales bacterium]|nr:PQQ-binding-like beta-propeller repeat protein [Ktedonobacterales bacterium]